MFKLITQYLAYGSGTCFDNFRHVEVEQNIWYHTEAGWMPSKLKMIENTKPTIRFWVEDYWSPGNLASRNWHEISLTNQGHQEFLEQIKELRQPII